MKLALWDKMDKILFPGIALGNCLSRKKLSKSLFYSKEHEKLV